PLVTGVQTCALPISAALVFTGAVALVPRIGKEFMPPLNEGDLMFMPVTDPAISLAQAVEIAKTQNAAIQAVPEVDMAVAKIAREIGRASCRESGDGV